MSAMFLDAMSGMTAGMKQAGAIIQQGQMQQVDAAWKNRELANKEELQAEQIATARSSRDLAAKQDERNAAQESRQRTLFERDTVEYDADKPLREKLRANKEAGLLTPEETAALKDVEYKNALDKGKQDWEVSMDRHLPALGFTPEDIQQLKGAYSVDVLQASTSKTSSARSSALGGTGSTSTSKPVDELGNTIERKRDAMAMVKEMAELRIALGEDLSVVNKESQVMMKDALIEAGSYKPEVSAKGFSALNNMMASLYQQKAEKSAEVSARAKLAKLKQIAPESSSDAGSRSTANDRRALSPEEIKASKPTSLREQDVRLQSDLEATIERNRLREEEDALKYKRSKELPAKRAFEKERSMLAY